MRIRLSALHFLGASLAVAWWLGIAATAHAVQIVVPYDNPAIGGFPAGFGTTEANADAAVTAGIDLRNVNVLGQATDFSIPQPDLISRSSLDDPTVDVQLEWEVTNDSGADKLGTVLLVFGRPFGYERDVDGDGDLETIVYDPKDVGITLRTDEPGRLDWEILRVPVDATTFVYYPAVVLGSMLDGQTVTFRTDLVLENVAEGKQIFPIPDPLKDQLQVPEWQLFDAFVPIPEPGTAMLVVSGLGGLALGRRRRS